MTENTNSPTGLYIHVPFCKSRCDYCAFASSVYNEGLAEEYIVAATGELFESTDGEFAPQTIYIGGGTPTSLSERQLVRLLDSVNTLELTQLKEFTVEANPGTVSVGKFMQMKHHGVTRVSIGMQSADANGLETLGRSHTHKQTRAALAFCREAGFEEISLDLIYGWPGQTEESWRKDLETVAELGITHVSCYCLTYEPGTPLFKKREKGQIPAKSEEEELKLFEMTEEILAQNGIERYEISNFCVPGHECLHNINYWRGGSYLGIGAGAHSFIDGIRTANCDNPSKYCKNIMRAGTAQIFEEKLSPEKAAREKAVIWLRMSEGIDADEFENAAGIPLEELYEKELPFLTECGFLEWAEEPRHLRLTRKSLPIADSVLSELV